MSAEGTKEECFNHCKKVFRDLKLDKAAKLYEMKSYLKNYVDVYIKPLIVHLMKNKPSDIHEAILNWA